MHPTPNQRHISHLKEGTILATTQLKQLWKNEYFQTVITIVLMIVIVLGFWYGLQFALGTSYPALAVASGSMCLSPAASCDGWTHPFERTLHVGDLIIIQKMKAEEIKAEPYPNGDIIVFRKPGDEDLIVHRAIAKENRSGTWYFQTKGDGNSIPDSTSPNIPEENVVGKVVMRVPWIGHLALALRSTSGIYILVILIIIVLIIQFAFPESKQKKTEKAQSTESSEKPPET